MDKVRLRIMREDDAMSPREWDNIGTMVCWHRGYNLGDEQPKRDPQEWRESANLPEGTIMLPLYVYEHGGITMSTGAFGDVWDSGQVGWIYVTPDRVTQEFGSFDDKARATAEGCLRAEVEVYARYLEGDVWHFSFEKIVECKECRHTTYEEIEACGGFYGDDKDGIAEHLPPEARALLDAAWDARE